jgi:F0F1-type ATP synthase assembly protein I
MEQKPVKAWWETSLRLFVGISGWIVFPILGGVYLGHWLDWKFNSEPWLYIITVGVAFIITNVGIIRKSLSAMNEIAAEAKKEREEQEAKKSL